MTRKHFQMIADLLRESRDIGVYKSAKGYGMAVDMWADELAKTNKAFNRYTFLKACGVV